MATDIDSSSQASAAPLSILPSVAGGRIDRVAEPAGLRSRPAIFPRTGYDDIVTVKDGKLHLFRARPGNLEKLSVGAPADLIVSNVVPVTSSTAGDLFELVMLVETAKGRQLRVIKQINEANSWESMNLGDARDYVGDPCVVATPANRKVMGSASEKDIYFVVAATAEELIVVCRTEKFYDAAKEKVWSLKGNGEAAPANGVAAGLDGTGVPRVAFISSHRSCHFRIASGDRKTWSVDRIWEGYQVPSPSFTGGMALHPGSDPNLQDDVLRAQRMEMVSVEPSGLVNWHYKKDGNTYTWLSQKIAGPARYGRPVLSAFGDQMVLVVRSGLKLLSFTATPDFDAPGTPRVWRALPDFGNSATGDPVLFYRPSLRTGHDCLVAVVEQAGVGLGYYWFNGGRWVVGWP